MTEGEAFGRYQLLKVVGTGGMAQVHLARQVGPNKFIKPCVVKRIAPEHRGNDVVRSLFLEEARISALLSHPNVVTTFDFGEVDGVPYLAMEWVDGVNLAQLCKALAGNDKWLAPGPAIDMVLGILEALDYAHQLTDLDGRPLHLVHRDVSPQNVLISRRGEVKLTDFGIARHEARETKTMGPVTKGKPGYMAPEQAMGGVVDGRADLYSAGIMLTELISARRVFAKREALSVLKVQERVRALFGIPRNLPRGVMDLALAMTAIEPEQRPRTARECAQRLRVAAEGLPLGTLSSVVSNIFSAYVKDTPAESGAGSGSSPGAASPPVPEIDVASTFLLPSPPPSITADLEFNEKSWAEQDKAEGTAAAYQGWPKPEPPPPKGSGDGAPAPGLDGELVRRSSSMDAFEYFGAVHSEEAKSRGAKLTLPLPPGVTPREQTIPPPAKPVVPAKPVIPLRSEAIDQALATAQDAVVVEDAPVRRRAKLQPLLPLIGAALAVLLVGLGVMAAFSQRGPEQTLAAKGALWIVSVPPAAAIFIDGKPTDRRTPAEFPGLGPEETHRVVVAKPGYLSVPREAQAKAQAGGRTEVRFELRRGRIYEVQSTPSDAVVSVNGKKLATPTPVKLEVLPFGETATITVELDGHLPASLKLRSAVETPTVAAVTLRPGLSLEIASEPVGAEVVIDGVPRGKAPIYDVMVPRDGSFQVLAKKRGYRPLKQRLVSKKLKDGPLVLELKPLPFLAMPMSAEERKEAKALDQKATRLELDRRRTADKLKTTEQKLAAMEASRQNFVGDVADVQRRVDELRAHLDEVENELSEVQASIDSMRDSIQTRMESEEE